MSLYSSLYRYRPSAGRSPFEDFLTEALVDILNRLTLKDCALLVSDCFLPAEAVVGWSSFLLDSQATRISWVSQHRIRGMRQHGIIDILMLIDGHERLLVENKVGAAFQIHLPYPGEEMNTDASNHNVVTQLTTYGQWLGEKCEGSEWPGAITLLTHGTRPPAGFLQQGLDGPYRHVVTWRSV